MNATLKKAIQFVLFLGIGLTVFYLVFRNQNAAYRAQCALDGVPEQDCRLVNKLWTDFGSVDAGWIVLVIIAFTISNIFRARRWQMLFEPMGYQVGFGNSLLTILLGYFANLGFPRMGEVVRAGVLARYEKLPVEKSVGTLVVDRVMDVVCLGVVVALAFIFQGGTLLQFIRQQQGVGTEAGGGLLQNTVLLVLLGLVAASLVALWYFRDVLMRLPLVEKVIGMVKGFAEGLRSVFKLRSPVLFIIYSAGIWLMFYLQCYFTLLAFQPTAGLGLREALMIFVFGTLGFVVPSPGGMGTFHVLAIAALALYGISGSDAFSYANISFFTIQIFYNLVAGILALILLPILNKSAAAKN